MRMRILPPSTHLARWRTQMELDQARIENAIIAEVADKMIGDDDLYGRIKKAVDTRIDKHFREVADAQIKAAIEDAVRTGFDHEYQKISSFGEPVAAKTTIRAELERMIAGYWNIKVDDKGNPATDSYGKYMTRAEWV